MKKRSFNKNEMKYGNKKILEIESEVLPWP